MIIPTLAGPFVEVSCECRRFARIEHGYPCSEKCGLADIYSPSTKQSTVVTPFLSAVGFRMCKNVPAFQPVVPDGHG